MRKVLSDTAQSEDEKARYATMQGDELLAELQSTIADNRLSLRQNYKGAVERLTKLDEDYARVCSELESLKAAEYFLLRGDITEERVSKEVSEKVNKIITRVLTQDVLENLLSRALEETECPIGFALGNLVSGYMKSKGFSTNDDYKQALAAQAIELTGRTKDDAFKYQVLITKKVIGKLNELVVDYVRNHTIESNP
ncbi:hypothetical protein HZA96_03515 [Candidatus Woesearchaeota archaeon]|nr:hypothetical protein [Candidatus Woesearchaeota archaeon]